MTVESESHRPNEFGYAGGATTPEPEPARDPAEEADAERVAVPSDDLTGAISEAVEGATQRDDR